MSNEERKIIEHDIRGQICPATLLIALKAINSYKDDLKTGSVELIFKTDSRDATLTIPDAALNMGYSSNVAKEQGYYLISVSASGR